MKENETNELKLSEKRREGKWTENELKWKEMTGGEENGRKWKEMKRNGKNLQKIATNVRRWTELRSLGNKKNGMKGM
jgi:hypothetical protein